MTYRSATGNSSTGTTSLSVNVPAGVADGDGMIAQVIWRSSATLTAPGGWTQVGTEQALSGDNVRYYTRIASSEPASYNWGLDASQRIVVNVLAFSTINTSGFVDTYDTTATGSGVTATADSITPSASGCDLVAFFAAGGNTAFSTASGMTESEDRNNGSNLSGAADTEVWTTGATGTRASTISSLSWTAALFALAPAAATASPVSLLISCP